MIISLKQVVVMDPPLMPCSCNFEQSELKLKSKLCFTFSLLSLVRPAGPRRFLSILIQLCFSDETFSEKVDTDTMIDDKVTTGAGEFSQKDTRTLCPQGTDVCRCVCVCVRSETNFTECYSQTLNEPNRSETGTQHQQQQAVSGQILSLMIPPEAEIWSLIWHTHTQSSECVISQPHVWVGGWRFQTLLNHNIITDTHTLNASIRWKLELDEVVYQKKSVSSLR